MNRIIHFEIHAGDPERAAKFYRDVFEWEIHEYLMPGVDMIDENRYWLVTTGPENEPGINGGLNNLQGGHDLSGVRVEMDCPVFTGEFIGEFASGAKVT